ncbi:hypothetical protein XENTR_v10019571 [Xenopus tropicalis]|uniref:Uncharacterized protein LOC101733353 n=2 Tax=Xenopus tropicalis TaxID=8364 RepID=A0A8J0R1J3_XENTR|nr:uncharacterized protein LOC101733353 [Xenopus tropicalis]KAE8594308.1 hypothetical protein XENTR_v10019571 [Xenopus tropicalis]|eukprot:XP_004916457.1 PREDICTED: uncharacterized protein LOC101733353 [Xenopus tropicalis]
MESNSNQRNREETKEGDQASTSHDAVSKNSGSMDTNANPPAEGSKAAEKKPHNPPTRPSSSSSSHQKPSHSLVQSSHSSGTTDLQPSVFGRSGSSISAMTVPIRLDALSYLLNNAIIGSHRMLPQSPYYGGSWVPSACPYQTGCAPYSPWMNQSQCFPSCSNVSASCQPGYFPYLNHEGNQSYQPSCFMQVPSSGKANLNHSSFTNCPAQSGIPWNPYGTSSGQSNSGPQQPEVNNAAGMSSDRFFNLANYSAQNYPNTNRPEGNGWNRRSTDRSSDAANDAPDGDKQMAPARKSFGRFGDKQEGDGWPGRQQRDFGRGGGRGRDDFGTPRWQNNSMNQDRASRFGDRRGYFSQRRDQDSPERFQGRGYNLKRGRWSNSIDTGGETRASWQQRTNVSDTSPWSDATTKENQSSSFGEAKQANEDEDWETTSPEEKSLVESTESSKQNAANADTVPDHLVTDDWEIKKESTEENRSSENVTSTSASLANEEEPSSSKDTEEEAGGANISFMQGSNKDEGDTDAKSEQMEVEITTGQDHVPSNSPSPTGTHPKEEKSGALETQEPNTEASGTDSYALVVYVPKENDDIVLEFVDSTDG